MTPVLALADVTFRRDGKQIIDGISLTVQRGEHWALLGPNGAGKSTLLGFCAAVTFPTSGTVHVLGEQMGRVDLARMRHSIGHVNPRHRLQYSLTVREVVLTGITATIDTPMRWAPDARRARPRRRNDRRRLACRTRRPTYGRRCRRASVAEHSSHAHSWRSRSCCCSTSRRPGSTSPRASSCSRPSTRSTRRIPRWPRSWSPTTSRSSRPPRRMRC